MRRGILDHLGHWIWRSNTALGRSWRRVVTPALRDGTPSADAADRTPPDLGTFVGVTARVITQRLPEVLTYWQVVKGELRRGMPADTARSLLQQASRVIHSWATLATAANEAVQRLTPTATSEEDRRALAAAISECGTVLDTIKRMIDLYTGPRKVDEGRLEAGRVAIQQGRYKAFGDVAADHRTRPH